MALLESTKLMIQKRIAQEIGLEVTVKVSEETGDIELYRLVKVTRKPINSNQIELSEARSYYPKVKIGDEYASQIMFVIGTDGGGSRHDNWRDNLKFAVKVEEKANELYPGLFKAILLRNSRYNQHVAKAACIIEVGATRKYFR